MKMNRVNRKENKKTLKATPSPKSPEVAYRKNLSEIVTRLRSQVNASIYPILVNLESEYVADAYAQTLQEAFDNLRARLGNLTVQAERAANQFTTNTNQINRNRFYSAVEGALGVNLSTLIAEEGIEDTLIASTRQNVSLIKSIPDEYFKKIESVVFTGTMQGRRARSMISELRDIGRVTERRAKLIARDQTSKLNSALNQQRQLNLGITEYIWRTAADDRVRESHRSKNGKVFKWNDPPKDTGHPGQDVQCRCVAQPIINI